MRSLLFAFVLIIFVAFIDSEEWLKEDINSPKIQEIVHEAVKLYNDDCESEFYRVPTKIISVECNGEDYRIKMRLCESPCSTKNNIEKYSGCNIKAQKLKEVTLRVTASGKSEAKHLKVDEVKEIKDELLTLASDPPWSEA
uniref:Cystatin domain-containing protein n=1 Tax=Panagrolaimus sp. JU765 TaxID=591449 RepID=A0AC34QCI6_9BILA